uniref:Putative nucleoprotein n=1 Tax=Ixodes ricinus TaxID=34613 RepID=A0A6B0VEY0_IXORI
MSRLLQIKNKDELDKWIIDFNKRYELNLNTTYTKSLAYQPSEPGCRIAMLSRMDSKPKDEIDSIISNAMVESLRYAAPVTECVWNLSETIFKNGIQWFEANKDQDCMKWDKKYDTLRDKTPTSDDIRQYQSAARKWRTDIGYGCSSKNIIMSGNITNDFYAPKKYINDLTTMVIDMRAKRRERLGISEEDEAAVYARKGAVHADWLERWMAETNEDQMFNLPEWGSWDKQTKKGLLLGGTAVAHLVQKQRMTSREFQKRHLDMVNLSKDEKKLKEMGIDSTMAQKMVQQIERCFSEGERLIEQSKAQTSAFVQQGSALDTPFSTYYWMWKADVTEANFAPLNEMAFLYGQKPVGQKKLLDALKGTAYKWGVNLANLCATGNFDGDRVHMHPGVFTPHRMSEMTATIGVFPLSNPVRFREGSASYRYLTNLHTGEGNPAAKVITELFRLFTKGHPNWQDKDAIVPPEHYLHQSLLDRLGPFCNVSKLKGDALKVKILGEYGSDG